MSSSARGSENSRVGGQYESRGFESENKGKVEGGETSLLNSVTVERRRGFCGFVRSVQRAAGKKNKIFYCAFYASFLYLLCLATSSGVAQVQLRKFLFLQFLMT